MFNKSFFVCGCHVNGVTEHPDVKEQVQKVAHHNLIM
jgi:hypothetical protein